ncbi:MAG: hypothetical protein Ta2B_03790 [Termitinemataceae bacterium]|nr:MAG: hypothetical protein Ta2B_03790 [Termitinemataceae bacterium]
MILILKRSLAAILSVFCLQVFCGNVFAQEARTSDIGYEQEFIVNKINITGLKRTKMYVAMAPLEKYRGMDSRQIKINDVIAAIEDTGILAIVNAEFVRNETGGTSIDITVHDKWSIFPIPLVFWSSEGFGIGGTFADTNAFGINDKMALALLFTDESWMIHLMYSHTAAKGMPGFSFNGGYNDSTSEHTDQTGANIYSRYRQRGIDAGIGVTYPVNEILSTSLRLGFDDKWNVDINSESKTGINPPLDGRISLQISPGISFRKANWDGKFLLERGLNAHYSCNIGFDSDTIHSFRLTGIFEHSIVSGFRFFSRAGLRIATESPLEMENKAQSVNVDILNGSYTARNFAAAAAGFEVALFTLKIGTVSALANYQAVYSQGIKYGGQIDHGFSSGLRLYMRSLAIPAMGLLINYNVDKNYLRTAFSLGMSI